MKILQLSLFEHVAPIFRKHLLEPSSLTQIQLLKFDMYYFHASMHWVEHIECQFFIVNYCEMWLCTVKECHLQKTVLSIFWTKGSINNFVKFFIFENIFWVCQRIIPIVSSFYNKDHNLFDNGIKIFCYKINNSFGCV